MLLFLLSAFAQPSKDIQWNIGAQYAFRTQAWSNPDFDATTNDHTWSIQNTIRAQLSLTKGFLSLYTSIQDVREWGAETNSVLNTNPSLSLYEGYAQFNLQNTKNWIRLGRQEFFLNDGRLFWHAPWNMAGKTFNGLRLHTQGDIWSYDLLGLMVQAPHIYTTSCDPETRDCTDFTPETINSNGDLVFLSDVDVIIHPALTINPFALALLQGPNTNNTARNRKIYNTGIMLKGKPAPIISYLFHGIYQFGSESPTISHSAWNLATNITLHSHAHSLRIFWEESSGDANPNDDVQHDFDIIYASKLRFRGWGGMVGITNTRDIGLELKMATHKSTTVLATYHNFQMNNPAGNWYNINGKPYGTPNTHNTDAQLGQEIDLRINYKPQPHTLLQFGAVYFQPQGHGAELTAGDPAFTSYLWLRNNI